MKRLLLIIALFFNVNNAFCVDCLPAFVGSCISTDGNGNTIITLITTNCNTGAPSEYLWIDLPGGLTPPIAPVSSYADPDIPGDIDYTYNITAALGITLPNQCYNIYFYYATSGLYPGTYTYTTNPKDGWAVTGQVCPCNPKVTSGCYFIGANGDLYVKLVSSLNGDLNMDVWLQDPSTSSYYTLGGNPTITLDADNVDWDYLFDMGPSNSINLNNNSCINVFYYTEGEFYYLNNLYTAQPPIGASSINICPCPTPAPVGGCFNINAQGNIVIKLEFSYADALQYGSGLSIWLKDQSGNTIYGSYQPDNGTSVTDPDGVHVDYTYTISQSGFTTGSCVTVYYSPSSADWDFPNQPPSYTICPCCANFNPVAGVSTTTLNQTTVSYQSNEPANWDFGDGNVIYNSLGGTHTYPSYNTYTICATSLNDYNTDGSFCRKCFNICLINSLPYSLGGGNCADPSSPSCNSDFTVDMDGHDIVANPVMSLLSYSYGLNAMPVWHWGDGSSSIWGNSHTYLSAGTYTICLEIDLVDQNNNIVCKCSETCMDVCISDPSPYQGSRIAEHEQPRQPNNGIELIPNPASDFVTMSFDLDTKCNVKVIITDVMGRIVRNVYDEEKNEGAQNIKISTADFMPGVYNVSIQTNRGIATQRLIIVK